MARTATSKRAAAKKNTARTAAKTSEAGTARNSATKTARKSAVKTARKNTDAKTATSTTSASDIGSKVKTGPAGRDQDWQAAREILTAHRTLARAERRETKLAAALKSHAKSIATLDNQTKKTHKMLDAARADLHASLKARKKVAGQLAALERANSEFAATTKNKKTKK